MKSPTVVITLTLIVSALAFWPAATVQASSPVIRSLVLAPRLTIQNHTNVLNQIQYTTNLSQGNW